MAQIIERLRLAGKRLLASIDRLNGTNLLGTYS
jgi:hypothetical protein